MSRLGEAIRRAAWAHGTTLRDTDVAERVATEIAAELGPTDEQIRALVRGVAQATVELVYERYAGTGLPMRDRHQIAEQIADATFGSAEDDPTHELHAVRGSG